MTTDIHQILNATLKSEIKYNGYSFKSNQDEYMISLLALCYSLNCVLDANYHMGNHIQRVLTLFYEAYPQRYAKIDINFVRYNVIKAKRLVRQYSDGTYE